MTLGKHICNTFNIEENGQYDFYFESPTEPTIVTIQYYTNSEDFDIDSVLFNEEYIVNYDAKEIKSKVELWLKR